jgi:diaminopimelate decarboxylase
MWSSSISLGDELSISGITATDLAREFGTPVFIMDEADFRSRAKNWDSALKSAFGSNSGTVYYAAKAFICTEVARWIKDIGIGIDVCTGGELAVALAGEIDPSTIQVHGNNKSVAEIDRAVSVGVGNIVIDSLFEIERVAAAAAKYGKIQKVLLRLTPGIEAHTHEFIATAHEDVKFGFSIASGAAWNAIEEVRKFPSIDLRGLHAHIGSQILDTESFEISAERLISLLGKYRDAFGVELPELDLGGGYGIHYLPGDEELEPAVAMNALAISVATNCALNKLKIPRISVEPGRAIVGPTMFTLYEVGTVKDVNLENGDNRRYISIDGGMSENIRPALYGAEYTAILANRKSTAALTSSRLVGKHCETGDILIREIDLASDIEPGDLLATPATGAYGRSMASNYNHVPRPPVVAVNNGNARIIVRRETETDLLGLDI